MRELILLNPFGLTGAPRQFSLGIAPPEPINLIVWRLDFSTKSGAYLLALAMLLIALAVMHRLDSSRVGLLVRSLSQNEILAQSLGVHAVALKVVAFCMSCFLARGPWLFRCRDAQAASFLTRAISPVDRPLLP